MSLSEHEIQKALELRSNRENTDGITDMVVDEIKSSLVFKHNWEELLSGVPVALYCIGSCFVASGSPVAQSLSLTLPSPNTTVLRWSKLQPNLVDCATLGTTAFIKAEEGMGGIRLQSKVIYRRLNDLVEVLGDPESAKTSLIPHMNAVQRAADFCHDEAKEIDEKFEDWLAHASHLHAICISQSAETEDRLQSVAFETSIAQFRATQSEASLSEAKSVTETLEKQLEITGEAYKKASAEFPDGWDLLGQQIVGTFAEATSGILNYAIPAIVDSFTPIATAVIDSIHPRKDGSLSTDSSQAIKYRNVQQQGDPQNQIKDVAHDHIINSDDPAYTSVAFGLNWFNLLGAILSGSEDGGMDWGKAAGSTSDSSKDSKSAAVQSNIAVVNKMLEDSINLFMKLATRQEPSLKYLKALKDVAKISSEILAKINESKSISSKLPDANSDIVRKWQEEFDTAYSAVLMLEAIAKSLPGSVKGNIPLYAESSDCTIEKENAKSAQANAMLEAAKGRLMTTQGAYIASMENYQKSTALFIEQQKALEAVKGEIKKVLVECIKLIIILKSQIVKLVRFFKAISQSIQVVVKNCVSPFIDDIAAITNGHSMALYKIGPYTYTDIQRSQIFNSSLSIRAYFSVFADIADMWLTVSQDHIFPGVELCDKISGYANDPMETKKLVRELKKYSEGSQRAIKEICQQKRDEFLCAMEARIESIKSETKQLPPSATAARAIEAGVQEAKQATNTSLEQASAKSPLKIKPNRFLSKKVV
ncbi:hypothetical protein TWF679_003697 [Orbilia oligospora]|uniref:Uncharacterized protein n=1 Tax=Orbilia oligospora TaxID=2813651 RepID=A0A8H8VF00_ORBOL|nr:hypothetical protein TWF679_003697 [Orbilia oligospora]